MKARPREDIEKIATLHNGKVSDADIAAQLGLSIGTVRYIKRENKELLVSHRMVDTPDMIAAAKKLFNRGLKYPAMAAEMGVTEGQVRGLVQRNPEHFDGADLRESRRSRTKSPGLMELQVAPRRQVKEFTAGLDALFASGSVARMPGEPVPLMELTATSCRWIASGAGASALYCGDRKQAGSSYCAQHHARAYSRRAG